MLFMPARSKTKQKIFRSSETTWYKGKQAKTGNSLGIRFDKALFQSHPEFNGDVRANVIAPGRMLVIAEHPSNSRHEEDPVIASFLSFLASDLQRVPHRITPLDKRLVKQINRLTAGIDTDPSEDLGNDTGL